MPKIVPDPTPDTMDSLTYSRIPGEKIAALTGYYSAEGATFKGTVDSTPDIEVSIDALYALMFVTPPGGPEASLSVKMSVNAETLNAEFVEQDVRGQMGVSGTRFDKQFADAAKNIFAQAFKAGMQAALGF